MAFACKDGLRNDLILTLSPLGSRTCIDKCRRLPLQSPNIVAKGSRAEGTVGKELVFPTAPVIVKG